VRAAGGGVHRRTRGDVFDTPISRLQVPQRGVHLGAKTERPARAATGAPVTFELLARSAAFRECFG
jgi:hypothetical protein